MQVRDRVKHVPTGEHGTIGQWDPFAHAFHVRLDQSGKKMIPIAELESVTITVLKGMIVWNEAGGYGYIPELRNWLLDEMTGKRVRITVEMLDEEG